MIIKRIKVKNYRCLEDCTLDCEPLTALVGANGCGKSSFLRALELFYTPSPPLSPEDFYSRDTSRKIEVEVTFMDLSPEAIHLFEPYVQEGTLTVTRVFAFRDGKVSSTYHGTKLRSPGFADIRSSAATVAKAKYAELQREAKYSSLPPATTRDAVLNALDQWEEDHPTERRRELDDGQFFGFTGVGNGYLGRHVRFILIPAVRDASGDATDNKGSPITELMDLVVRNTLAQRADVQQFKSDVRQRYAELFDPEKMVPLQELAGTLTTTLQTYVPDAEVRLSWSRPGEMNVLLPVADVTLVEDGFGAAVTRTGHGLQRAFILSMLQRLTVVRASAALSSSVPAEQDDQDGQSSAKLPDLVLIIEEPELYQHPNRQRHLASILMGLAQGAVPGVSQRTQVVYATHSPLFVGLDRFDQVRVLRKAVGGHDLPKVTRVTHVTGDSVANDLWDACEGKDAAGRPVPTYTWESLRPRLQSIMTPLMNEGFFADVAILVEGGDDRAVVLGTAWSLGIDLEAEGISVLPCYGKCNLDRPLVVFRRFGIPTYVLWDGDKDKATKPKESHPEVNRRLLRLSGANAEDWPTTTVGDTYACLEHNLERTLQDELGLEFYESQLERCRDEVGIGTRTDAIKCPSVFQMIIEAAAAEGKVPPTLKQVIERARKLRGSVVLTDTKTVSA
ncbi:MAG: ATP-dependent endonuclease [Chloroflexi bacterium]|nr:ATP-dependent endonuclease [Chloroflexota bacterium]